MQIILRWLQYLVITALAAAALVIAIDDTLGVQAALWFAEVLPGQSGRLAVAGVGVALITAQALLLARWLTLRRFAREIGYQNEFGKVSVSLVAIEEALTRTIEGEAGVRRVSLRVYEDRVKRCVIIEPVLTLWEDHSVTAVNHRCQEILRARFAELMPERTQVQVNLTLHRLNQRPAGGADRQRRGKTVTGDLPAPPAAMGPVPTVTYAEDLPEPAAAPAPPLLNPDLPPRIASSRLAAIDPTSQARRLSEVDDDEDLDYDSLYAGPTYPVDRDDDDGKDSKTNW